jgi:hypothetical protein
MARGLVTERIFSLVKTVDASKRAPSIHAWAPDFFQGGGIFDGQFFSRGDYPSPTGNLITTRSLDL